MYEIQRLNDHAQGAISFGGVSDPRGKPPLLYPGHGPEAIMDYLLGSHGAREATIRVILGHY